MQVVSFETARRLKEAGFPAAETGCFYIGEWPDNTEDEIRFGFYFNKPSDYLGPIYAPTATELMDTDWFLLKSGTEEWLVFTSYYNVEDFRPFGQHSNPAEAAAMAYFHVHEKEEQ